MGVVGNKLSLSILRAQCEGFVADPDAELVPLSIAVDECLFFSTWKTGYGSAMDNQETLRVCEERSRMIQGCDFESC